MAKPEQGEIYWVDFGEDSRGGEIDKDRPGVVVSWIVDPVGNTVLAIPLTTKELATSAGIPPYIRIKISPSTQNGLDKISWAIPLQMRALDIDEFRKRFNEKIGDLESAYMEQISKAIIILTRPEK